MPSINEEKDLRAFLNVESVNSGNELLEDIQSKLSRIKELSKDVSISEWSNLENKIKDFIEKSVIVFQSGDEQLQSRIVSISISIDKDLDNILTGFSTLNEKHISALKLKKSIELRADKSKISEVDIINEAFKSYFQRINPELDAESRSFLSNLINETIFETKIKKELDPLKLEDEDLIQIYKTVTDFQPILTDEEIKRAVKQKISTNLESRFDEIVSRLKSDEISIAESINKLNKTREFLSLLSTEEIKSAVKTIDTYDASLKEITTFINKLLSLKDSRGMDVTGTLGSEGINPKIMFAVVKLFKFIDVETRKVKENLTLVEYKDLIESLKNLLNVIVEQIAKVEGSYKGESAKTMKAQLEMFLTKERLNSYIGIFNLLDSAYTSVEQLKDYMKYSEEINIVFSSWNKFPKIEIFFNTLESIKDNQSKRFLFIRLQSHYESEAAQSMLESMNKIQKTFESTPIKIDYEKYKDNLIDIYVNKALVLGSVLESSNNRAKLDELNSEVLNSQRELEALIENIYRKDLEPIMSYLNRVTSQKVKKSIQEEEVLLLGSGQEIQIENSERVLDKAQILYREASNLLKKVSNTTETEKISKLTEQANLLRTKFLNLETFYADKIPDFTSIYSKILIGIQKLSMNSEKVRSIYKYIFNYNQEILQMKENQDKSKLLEIKNKLLRLASEIQSVKIDISNEDSDRLNKSVEGLVEVVDHRLSKVESKVQNVNDTNAPTKPSKSESEVNKVGLSEIINSTNQTTVENLKSSYTKYPKLKLVLELKGTSFKLLNEIIDSNHVTKIDTPVITKKEDSLTRKVSFSIGSDYSNNNDVTIVHRNPENKVSGDNRIQLANGDLISCQLNKDYISDPFYFIFLDDKSLQIPTLVTISSELYFKLTNLESISDRISVLVTTLSNNSKASV